MSEKQYRVNVFEDEKKEKVIARVRYNADLDSWDGQNYTSGSTGHHMGITKLANGSYVVIYGSDWQGDKDYAIVVPAETALQLILKHGHEELLSTKKFDSLQTLYMDSMLLEDGEELED